MTKVPGFTDYMLKIGLLFQYLGRTVEVDGKERKNDHWPCVFHLSSMWICNASVFPALFPQKWSYISFMGVNSYILKL